MVSPDSACAGRTNYTAISQIKGESAHHGLFEENVRTLSTYKKQEIAHMLTDYYKFTIVRNPLTRYISVRGQIISHTVL